jgi:hypothetical protein
LQEVKTLYDFFFRKNIFSAIPLDRRGMEAKKTVAYFTMKNTPQSSNLNFSWGAKSAGTFSVAFSRRFCRDSLI